MKRCYILLTMVITILVACKDDINPPLIPKQIDRSVATSYHEATIVDRLYYSGNLANIKILYFLDSDIDSSFAKNQVFEVTPTVIHEHGYYELKATINHLEDNTTYYYVYQFVSEFDSNRKNDQDYIYSNVMSFTTLKNQAPEVSTVGCSNFGFYTAVLNCEKTSDNSDSPTTSWGICYSLNEDVNVDSSKRYASDNKNGMVSLEINNLIPGTTYFYRAFGINKYGTSYGELKSFTTVSTSIMKVETQKPSTIESTLAILCGDVISYAVLNVTEKGFYISDVNTNPDENDTMITSIVAGEGAYQCHVNNLQNSTKYYVRAYATCQYGTIFGNTLSFYTKNQ